MNDELILKRRMEAHRAACADLESDPLIRAMFDKPAPISPLPTPVRPGAFLKRQAA